MRRGNSIRKPLPTKHLKIRRKLCQLTGKNQTQGVVGPARRARKLKRRLKASLQRRFRKLTTSLQRRLLRRRLESRVDVATVVRRLSARPLKMGPKRILLQPATWSSLLRSQAVDPRRSTLPRPRLRVIWRSQSTDRSLKLNLVSRRPGLRTRSSLKEARPDVNLTPEITSDEVVKAAGVAAVTSKVVATTSPRIAPTTTASPTTGCKSSSSSALPTTRIAPTTSSVRATRGLAKSVPVTLPQVMVGQ